MEGLILGILRYIPNSPSQSSQKKSSRVENAGTLSRGPGKKIGACSFTFVKYLLPEAGLKNDCACVW